MSCPTCKRLCKRLIISSAVTFTGGNLVINLPTGNYADNEKYCIVVAQNIPTTTTINAPVVITIGTGTTTYPLMNCDCTNVTACSINRRTRYSVCVHTNISNGVFKLLGKLPCSQCGNNLASLPVSTTPTSASSTSVVAQTNQKGADK